MDPLTERPPTTAADHRGSAGESVGPRRPRVIVSDLDGTFLLPDGTVSDLNRQAVAAAHEAGIAMLFATGRPLRWLDVIADLPGAHPLVIASNGAILYDQSTEQVVDRRCLEPDTTVWAIEAIRAALPDAAFGLESGHRFGHDDRYLVLMAKGRTTDPSVYSGDIAEIAAESDQVKLLVQHPYLGSDDLLRAVRDALGDDGDAGDGPDAPDGTSAADELRAADGTSAADGAGGTTARRRRGLVPTHSGVARRGTRETGLVEISAPGVSKAAMLARCCEHLGVAARDVAAFGDMPNDVDMLSWAGMPRVVANAHRDLLSRYPVVGANSDSGVGRAILDWLS